MNNPNIALGSLGIERRLPSLVADYFFLIAGISSNCGLFTIYMWQQSLAIYSRRVLEVSSRLEKVIRSDNTCPIKLLYRLFNLLPFEYAKRLWNFKGCSKAMLVAKHLSHTRFLIRLTCVYFILPRSLRYFIRCPYPYALVMAKVSSV